MVALSVLVPEERVGEFYALVGRFHVPTPAAAAPAPRRRGASRGQSRYAPLRDFFAAASGDAVALSFKRVEELLGSPLPESARRHRSFWANSAKLSSARAWMEAGWEVASLDMRGERVVFERSR